MTGSVGEGVGHRSLSFYSATPGQGVVPQAAALSSDPLENRGISASPS
jgi:hypothetical protein